MKKIFGVAIALFLFSHFSFAEISSYIKTDFSTDFFYSFSNPKKEVFGYSQGINFGVGQNLSFAQIGVNYFIPLSANIESNNVKNSPCYGFEISAAYERYFPFNKIIFPVSLGFSYRYYELTSKSSYKNYLGGIFITSSIRKAINEELYCGISLKVSYFPLSLTSADSNTRSYSDFAVSPSFIIGGFLF